MSDYKFCLATLVEFFPTSMSIRKTAVKAASGENTSRCTMFSQICIPIVIASGKIKAKHKTEKMNNRVWIIKAKSGYYTSIFCCCCNHLSWTLILAILDFP